MLTPIVFWGASGQARVLNEFMPALGFQLVAIFDNSDSIESPFPDVPLYIGHSGFHRWRKEHRDLAAAFLIAIGGSRGRDRLELHQYLIRQDLVPNIAIHPSAFVASSAHVGSGSQVLAKAAVCADVSLGEACIVNTAASVDHESVIADGVHIGPGATLAGCVTVGRYTLVGAGAVVLPRVTIGADTVVGAGAVVTKDVPDGKVVYGNPATIHRDNT